MDPIRERIEALVTERVWDMACRYELARIDNRARTEVPLPEQGAAVFQGETATVYLTALRKWVEHELSEQIGRFSSFKWLWYLRRLPRFVFEGSLITTFPYDSGLAECASAMSPATSPYQVEEECVVYKIKSEPIQHVLKYCADMKFLSQLHANLRWAGKGVEIDFTTRRCGEALPNEDQRTAVELYDARVERENGPFLNRTGTLVSKDSTLEHLGMSVPVVYGLREPTFGPILTGTFPKNMLVGNGYAYFGPSFVSLDDLGRLNADPLFQQDAWWPEDAPVLLMFLRLSMWYLMNTKHAMANLQRFGYFVAHRSFITSIPAGYVSDARDLATRVFPTASLPETASEFIPLLSRMSGSLWPLLPGPPIRSEGDDLICLDLYTATMEFQSLLEFRRAGGASVNVRSKHFEVAAQDRIDRTAWRPTGQLSSMRGSELRNNGRKITDIDALGVRDHVLLLVSCKSKAYSARHDVGDYRTLRNEASAIAEAVQHWQEVAEFLRAHPVGDNYDFSEYEVLVPVVVTPHVVYAHQGPCLTEVVPGLRAAVSMSELERWLQNM